MSLQANEWHISKAHKNCFRCQKVFETGEILHSCVEEDATTFLLSRQDYCERCWVDLADKKAITNWKTTKSAENNKKPIIVDNDVLLNLFERLKDSESERNRSYAYLLSLILMRKRVLVFEDVRFRNGEEFMVMSHRPKREGEANVEVIDPHLSPEQINSLSDDLNKLISIGDIALQSD